MADFQVEQLMLLSFEELQELRTEYEEDILNRRIIDTAIDEKHHQVISKKKYSQLTPDEIKNSSLNEMLIVKELAKRPLKNEHDIKRVQINLLIWELPDTEIDCIQRIIQYTTHPYKLVCYDNRLNSFQGCNTAMIWNKLIKESDCEYNMILDSDAFIQHPGWLEKFIQGIDSDEKAAMIGPVTGFHCSGVPSHQEEYIENGPVESTSDHLSGFCFLLKKSIYNKIGPFDEDYFYFGQDSDWCNRVHETGYKLLIHRGVQVIHGHPELRKWSLSSITSRDTGQLNWLADSKYAGSLVQHKMKQRTKPGVKYTYKNNRLHIIKHGSKI